MRFGWNSASASKRSGSAIEACAGNIFRITDDKKMKTQPGLVERSLQDLHLVINSLNLEIHENPYKKISFSNH